MYSRNATRVPTLIAPEVTRAPPTARMARNAHWIERPAVFPAIACHFAAPMSARHAPRAAAWMRSPSRRSAPDALIVRNAPSIRSSAAPIAPTESCACRAARPILGTTTPITSAVRLNKATVTPSSTTSIRPIRTSVATRVTLPVTTPTTEPVVTSRSNVVSEVTRDIKSPGSVRSRPPIVSPSRRSTSRCRAASTTDSAVRRST